MKIIVLLSVRNGKLFIRRALEHLVEQGLETIIINNDSTDNTLEICSEFLNRGVISIERVPYKGSFQLDKILSFKEKLTRTVKADWFIHHDADEIRLAPKPYKTLQEGIEAVDREGYNAINFDEFVFVPTVGDGSFAGTDYVKEMKYYYYFARSGGLHRVNAWKNTGTVIDLKKSAGHAVAFEGRKIYPTHFILRHYIALSRANALQKYAGRVYSTRNFARYGWHLNRLLISPQEIILPRKEKITEISEDNTWDKSKPFNKHIFFVPKRPNAAFRLPPPDQGGKWYKNIFNIKKPDHGETPPPMPFIVGVSRSGTTLLRLMLDAHPELTIPPETYFIPSLFSLLGKRFNLMPRFVARLTSVTTWDDFGIPKDVLRAEIKNTRDFCVTKGLRRFYELYAEQQGKKRWGDKTPRYNLSMLGIQQILPEARFIHIIRDGRDVAVSLRHLWFGPGRSIEDQAADWMWRIREARQQSQSCRHYLEIKYEDLLTDTTAILNKICDFIELPYDSSMEHYHQTAGQRLGELGGRFNRRGVLVATKEERIGIHDLTGKPPDQTRIGRWKKELPPEEQEPYHSIAGDMLSELGYKW